MYLRSGNTTSALRNGKTLRRIKKKKIDELAKIKAAWKRVRMTTGARNPREAMQPRRQSTRVRKVVDRFIVKP